jgi:hypothetical protein
MIEYYYLARDRESGMIVDCGFWTFSRTKRNVEDYIREHCDICDYDMIDFDGSFFVWPWLFRRRRRPKWENERPQNISADEWARRLKSTEEVVAYHSGFQAGKNNKR